MKFDAIILAAGKGKRMKPFSDIIAKPMLPILNKPLVSLIIEQLLPLGAEKIVITYSKSNELELKNYFQTQPYSKKIVFCLQDPPKGTADAIYKAGLLCTSDILYSMAGDNLFSESFTKSMIIDFLKNKNTIQCIMALMKVSKEEITKLASVKLNNVGLITDIIEKPKPNEVTSTLASLSMYIFDKKLLHYFGSVPLSSRGEYEAPDAFLTMMKEKKTIKIKGLVTNESYIHISNPKDLWKCNMDLLEKHKNLLAENVKIGVNSSIIHCVVGRNSIIEENSIIEDTVILENTIIPAKSIIKQSIVGSSEKGIENVQITEEN